MMYPRYSHCRPRVHTSLIGQKAVTALFKVINEHATANIAHTAAEVGMQHFILISSVLVT